MANELTGATTELLQTLIRNECVNDGTPDSGGEVRNADLLQHVPRGHRGRRSSSSQSRPGRGRRSWPASRAAIPTAPTLCLMGHTDVVPVNPAGWSRDPFGGELIDGEVWGRGAIDMLNITASMAVAFRELARSGWRPKGTLIYFGVADEEAGGNWGAEWMCDHHWDAIASDYVLTEIGGWSTVGARRRAPRRRSTPGRRASPGGGCASPGTPAHGSMPFGADNALIKAAEVVRRLADLPPAAEASPTCGRRRSRRCRCPTTCAPACSTRRGSGRRSRRCRRRWRAPATPPRTRRSRRTSSTAGRRRTSSPTLVDLDVDIRTVPGTTQRRRRRASPRRARRAGPPRRRRATSRPATRPSRRAATRCGTRSRNATQVAYPGAELLPGLIVGGTDARFFREKGAVAYGAGLFSPAVTLESFGTRFHGNDERIDVESLGLAADFWIHIAKEICG